MWERIGARAVVFVAAIVVAKTTVFAPGNTFLVSGFHRIDFVAVDGEKKYVERETPNQYP